MSEVVPINGRSKRVAPEPEQLPKGVLFDTDLANAHRLQRTFGHELRYVHALGWHAWAATHWSRDETREAERRVHSVARAHIEQRAADLLSYASTLDDEEKRKRLQQHAAQVLRWASKSQAAKAVEAALRMASALEAFSVAPAELDRDPMLFACANGTLDLRTGKLREAQPSDLITKASPVAFVADARCPTWDAFLRRIFVDDELIGYVQRACGYSLTGCTHEQCLFVCWGEGANGKSTLLEEMRFVAGGYGQTTPTATLMDSQKSEHRNDIARLAGARFVTASESAEGKRFDEELIKRITGGDKMAARFLRREHFEFTPALKLWIATNHKPEVRGVDHGIWRRLKLIPFSVTIPLAEQDPKLGEKLRAESAGILAWAVRGCLEWQAGGLRAPAVVADATHQWRKEANQVAQFVDERCVTGTADYVRAKSADLYAAYREWARESGHETLSLTAFGIRLDALGFKATRTMNARLRLGLSLRPTDDQRTGA